MGGNPETESSSGRSEDCSRQGHPRKQVTQGMQMDGNIDAVASASGGMGRAIVSCLIDDGLSVAGIDIDIKRLPRLQAVHGDAFLDHMFA